MVKNQQYFIKCYLTIWQKIGNKSTSFPRMVYNIEWRYHAERKTDGIMAIDIYCTNENKSSRGHSKRSGCDV